MSLRRAMTSLVAGLAAGALGASPAGAAFVPALQSPFPTGETTMALTVGDADRNGAPDVAAGGLRLLRGDGTGRLLGGVPVADTDGPVEDVAIGDLDGDGLRDLAAIVPGTPRRVVTYRALAGGGYAAVEALADAGEASALAISNVNGDGLADVVVVEADGGSNVSVLRNLGDVFVESAYPSNLPAPADVAIGDLDGDGAPDVAVAGGEAGVATLLNEGDGTFADGSVYPAGTVGTAERLALARLDGDGKLDAVVADSGGTPAIAVLQGSGGGFVGQGRRATGLAAPPQSIDLDDVDGDGPLDVVAGTAGGRFALLTGDGRLGFAAASGSPFGNGDSAAGTVEDIAAVDMNHDGQPDVVTANRPGTVSVMLNSATGLLLPEPAGIRFGTMPAGAPTRGGSIVLRSVRGRLRITRLDLQGPRSFSVDPRGCVGKTLLRGQGCSVHVTYTAARKAGRQQALLSVDANAAAVVIPLGAIPRAPIVSRLRVAPRPPRAGRPMLLRYRLSEAARARVLLQRGVAGRRVAGECVPLGRANRRRRPCTVWTTLARTPQRGRTGANRLRLRARAGGRALVPGRYRLSVSAADRFRNRSDERYVKFRIAQAARGAK